MTKSDDDGKNKCNSLEFLIAKPCRRTVVILILILAILNYFIWIYSSEMSSFRWLQQSSFNFFLVGLEFLFILFKHFDCI